MNNKPNSNEIVKTILTKLVIMLTICILYILGWSLREYVYTKAYGTTEYKQEAIKTASEIMLLNN